MKKKNWKTGLSLTLCVLMLMTCFFPASVTALEGAADKQETQQSQPAETQTEQKDTSRDAQQKSENKDDTERTDKAETKTQQQDKRELNDTQTKASLSSIIAQDKGGRRYQDVFHKNHL